LKFKLALRNLEYSACDDRIERINLGNPDEFSIDASPEIIKQHSRRFGIIERNLMRIDETQFLRRKLDFRFKKVQIYTGFEMQEAMDRVIKLLKIEDKKISLSVAASSTVSDDRMVWMSPVLKNYRIGQTQIRIKLGHLFDKTLTCHWVLIENKLLKTPATVVIQIKERVITLSLKIFDNYCTETHYIENRKVSEEIRIADVRFHSSETPLYVEFYK